MIKSIRTLRSQRNTLIVSIKRLRNRLEKSGHVLGVNEKLSLKERIIAQKVKLIDLNERLLSEEKEADSRFYVSYTRKNGEHKEIPVFCRVA